ncbi:hypothetical protein ATI61_106459 [Archangium gephyra]|uniref:Uncharacterized protein n=1 Tax=Archangium gephyra TaxID=48 RepID=A0ABX9K106_9BACT|nr:hypothetical protein [Archangium gephyra]REG30989.1 hypothetical protein ATI61_106459 [Archangium gephyra]
MSRDSISKARRLRTITTLPPHANAENHKRIMEKLKTMTQAEFFQSLVDAGIYTPKGRLTRRYAGAIDLYPVLTPEQMGIAPAAKALESPRRTSAKTAARKSPRAPRRKSAKDSRR